jgi:hypothetical protein
MRKSHKLFAPQSGSSTTTRTTPWDAACGLTLREIARQNNGRMHMRRLAYAINPNDPPYNWVGIPYIPTEDGWYWDPANDEFSPESFAL